MTLTKITSKSLKDNEIVNADLHSAAAIATTKLAKPIDLADNEKIRFGGGQDLEIFHDENDSIISDGGTGNLLLKTNGSKVGITTGGGVEIANFINNGRCELFHTGDKKIRTDAFGAVIMNNDSGNTILTLLAANNQNAKLVLASDNSDDNGDEWTISNVGATQKLTFLTDIGGSSSERMSLGTNGSLEISGNLKMGNSQEIRLGDFSGTEMLKLYHDGSNSIITSFEGDLYVNAQGDDLFLKSTDDVHIQVQGSEDAIVCYGNGTVHLKYDGTTRLLTNSNGFTSYGSSFNMLSDNGSTTDAAKYMDVQIGGSVFYLRKASGGDANHGTMAHFHGDGEVRLYHNNEARFETTSSGAKVYRNDDNDTDCYLIVANERNDTESDAAIRISVANGSANSQIEFGDNGDSDAGEINYYHSNNRFRYFVSGGMRFEMRADGFCPTSTGKSCGFSNSSNRWDDVRSNNFGGSSDRNEKNTIVPSDLGLDFVNKLKPVSFKWNDGNAGRTHYGLVAQDIEDLLPEFKKTAMDFAALCKDTITEDGEGDPIDKPYEVYSLRYTEFIAPLVKAIQELSTKVAALEAA